MNVTAAAGHRPGRGARERILVAARRLFADHGINGTGMSELCAEAQVSKRTAYQLFATKDRLVAEHLRAQDLDHAPGVYGRDDLTPREHLVAVFEPEPAADGLTPLCPFLRASVEVADAANPARIEAKRYKQAVADRLADIARAGGATDPVLLGEQLALLLDGASVRTRELGVEALPTAARIARALIDEALP